MYTPFFKNMLKAIVCVFFALTIVVVNLPHLPIFQAKAQTNTQQVTNTEINQCNLNIDFGTGDITQNYSKNCCSLPDRNNQQLRTDDNQVEKHIRNIALLFVLFALSIFTTLALTYLINTRIESKMVEASRDSKMAQYAADAGIQEVIARLNSSFGSSSGSNVFDESPIIEGLMISISDIENNSKSNSDVPDLDKFVNDKPKVANANRRMERIEQKLTKFLSICTEQILCANQDEVFKQNILSPDNRLLPAVIQICLNRVGIALLGNSKAPCICTYKGCSCKPNAVCKSGKCSDDESCNCSPDGECICPLDRVCEKVNCISKNSCICVDSLCNADSDCGEKERCNTSTGLNQTFSGVSGSIGSSSGSSTSSSSGTFTGVAGSLSSSGNCGVVCPAGTTLNTTTCSCDFNSTGSSSSSSGGSSGTFSGVPGSIGSSSGSSSSGGSNSSKDSDCDGICDSPRVFSSSTCMCECPDLQCPAGTFLNQFTCSCQSFRGICINNNSEESKCGDEVIDENEECDDGASNSLAGPCLPTCELAGCGDEIFQPGLGEECDDGNNNNGDNCSADCLIEACTSNNDCESGFCVTPPKGSLCTKSAENNCPQDYETKICAPKFCKKNSQCGVIGVCRYGKCRPKPCRADDDCDGVDNDCDTKKGICVSRPSKPEVCDRDDDCDNDMGEVCDNGTCSTSCHDDEDCSSGKRCDIDKKICVIPQKPKPGKCTDDDSCSRGEVCDNGTCDTLCDRDDDCNSGMCDTMIKTCTPANKPKVCNRDDDCDGLDEDCDTQKGICVSKPEVCGKDEDCDAQIGEVCSEGRCTSTCGDGPCVVFPVSCLNVKCPVGLVCKNGKCVVECNSDNECKPPRVCRLGKCLLD